MDRCANLRNLIAHHSVWKEIITANYYGRGQSSLEFCPASFGPNSNLTTMMRPAPVVSITCIMLIGCSYGAMEQTAFHQLVPAATNQMVLMYNSGSPESDDALVAFEKAEALVRETALPGSEKLSWKLCDTNFANNRAEMELKGLTIFPMVFVAVEGQGMGNRLL
jgi:hypothetical protein